EREAKVLALLRERFTNWQKKGYIPTRRIESGEKTDEPIRTRGWTHWHHLFHPRQLLTLGLFQELASGESDRAEERADLLLEAGRLADTKGIGARLLRWNPHPSKEGHATVFSNQALNTLYNFCHRPLSFTTPNTESVAPIAGS